MWVIFRDPKTVFNHLDKFVMELVADEDILTHQKRMVEVIGGRGHDIMRDVYFLQPFFTSAQDIDYFAKKYKPWSP